MTDSLKLSTVGRSLRIIPVFTVSKGQSVWRRKTCFLSSLHLQGSLSQEASSHKEDEGLSRTMKSKC